MRAVLWPNKLGYDVGQHEVWIRPNGSLGVRLYKNGLPWKTHGAEAGTHPVEAVKQAKKNGTLIESC